MYLHVKKHTFTLPFVNNLDTTLVMWLILQNQILLTESVFLCLLFALLAY